MSEQTGEILDFLRFNFARQDDQHEKTHRQMMENTARLGRMETTMAGVRRDNADTYGHIVALSQRLDVISERIDRIERRLGIAEPAV